MKVLETANTKKEEVKKWLKLKMLLEFYFLVCQQVY